jgi:hypothetical protein
VLGIFEIGSFKLFAQADFETRASWSLPPEWLGLQAWVTSAWPTLSLHLWLPKVLCTLRASFSDFWFWVFSLAPLPSHLSSCEARLSPLLSLLASSSRDPSGKLPHLWVKPWLSSFSSAIYRTRVLWWTKEIKDVTTLQKLSFSQISKETGD